MTRADELALAPRLKIKRAKHHINDLSAQIDAFMAKKPFKMFSIFDPANDRVALRTKAEIPIPPEFAVIAGDAIHNLRSALDLTIYAFAKDTAANRERIAFPFSKTEEGLKGAIPNAQVQFAGKKVVEAVTALKPYPDGNELLSSVHELDIRDKHRLLLLSRRVPKISADLLGKGGLPFVGPGIFIFQTPEDEDLIVINRCFGTVGQRINLILSRPTPWEEETEVQPTFDISLAEALPLDVGPLVAALRICADAVDEAVGLLIEAFLDPDN